MKWTTRAHLHLDRTASAWLIRLAVDPEAQFEFLGWDQTPDTTDERHFGMPGVTLSGHDANGTCFNKILRTYQLTDNEALMRLEACVDAGVRHALGMARTEQNEKIHGMGVTLDLMGTGLALTHQDDIAHLQAATPLYNALNAHFQLPDLSDVELPNTQPERHNYLRSLIN